MVTGCEPVSDVALRDGSVVTLREIEPSDADALVRFHERLSPESIRMRYFSSHPHLSQIETARLTTVDHRDRQAFVVVADGEIVGVGRYVRANTDDAEVAFIIADAWQGRGLGSVLLQQLAGHARRCGFRRLTASTLAHNRPMLAVFRGSGMPMRMSLDAGVVDVSLTLD
jgi:RimJ/RimL family protein N-acetyltransferase